MAYRPPSQRRRGFHPSKGAIAFCCLLLFMGGFIAYVVYDYNRPEPGVPAGIEKPKAPEGPVDDSTLIAENQKRQDNARAVTYGGGNFYRANSYAYPTAFTNGTFTGPTGTKPQAVKLTHYKTVSIASGAQQPVKTDEIRFVSDAACAPSLSATIANKDSYNYVVQYAIQQPDGSFSSQCLKL